MEKGSFIHHAWRTIAEAVARAGVYADLHLEPATLSRTVKRRCLAELRRLAILLRRLITLMALAMQVSPPAPREGRNWFSSAQAPRKPQAFRLSLAPTDLSAPLASLCPGYGPPAGPPSAAPVIARWHAMLDVLKHAELHAARLARTLHRQKAAGAARPYVPPIEKAHRMPAALGLVSGALTVQLRAAFADWPDTG